MYYRGEVNIWSSRKQKESWPVDGFARNANGSKVYEFLGDRFHLGCPKCHPGKKDFIWEEKKADIEHLKYEVEFIWECQFDEQLKNFQDLSLRTSIPDILKRNQSERDIIDGIRSGRLYGFIICDIQTPQNVIEELKDFPPVIKRMTITEAHLTDYMADRIKMEKPTAGNFQRKTLVQCFHATDHLLLTTLAQYYLQKGLVISNITRFIQYVPKKCLSPFVTHVTDMRIAAERENLRTKGDTAKNYGNSGYGKVII